MGLDFDSDLGQLQRLMAEVLRELPGEMQFLVSYIFNLPISSSM